jgi:Flp pilus assembly protein TadG
MSCLPNPKQLWNDRDGAILPYVAIMLIAIIGLAGLAIDGSRLMSVQTQLQNAADALALAGAAELDRRPDSITRARAAIDSLIANPIVGAGINQVAQVSNIAFLQSLPVSEDLPITDVNLTDDPTLAAYVQVTVKPVSFATLVSSVPAGRTPANKRGCAGGRRLRPDRLQRNAALRVQSVRIVGYDLLPGDAGAGGGWPEFR